MSFNKKIFFIMIGTLLINFLLVFGSFNFLVSGYMKRNLENTLLEATESFSDIKGRVLHANRTANILIGESGKSIVDDAENNTQESSEYNTSPSGSAVLADEGIRVVTPSISFSIQATAPDFDVFKSFSLEPGIISVSSVASEIMGRSQQAASNANMKLVLMADNYDVLYPNKYWRTAHEEDEVSEIVNFFKDNPRRLTDANVVNFSTSDKIYSATTTKYENIPGVGNGYAIIYTDDSEVMYFIKIVNIVLLLILIIGGLLSAFISTRMTAGINKSILALSNHAKSIGLGNFGKSITVKEKDLNQLAISMNLMSSQLEQYDSEQKKFFQNVSHELRTPLMSVQGYAEGINSGVFDDVQFASGVIVDESKRLSNLVDDLLYISRLDTGFQSLQCIDTDVRDILNMAVEQIHLISINAGISISCNFCDEAAMFNADEKKLCRALLNILSNAVRHAKSNINIDCKKGKRVEIVISDDGDGILDEDMPHIFERFYKGVNGNVGIGLSLAKEIIELHDGKISARNLDGSGAQFTIIL